ncbi:CPBP family intramembrane metalloprotease [Halobellus sp. Atlit-38R]|nr:CPBP family intramembrane metalloprotease [Halobellus sp. Atlit-38R]
MGEASVMRGSTSTSEVSIRRRASVFTVVTLAFSWALWTPLVVGAISMNSDLAVLLILFGGFGPAVGAALSVSMYGGSIRAWLTDLLSVPRSVVWFVVALLIPPTVLTLTAVLHVRIGEATFGLDPRIALAGYPLSLVSISLLGGGQEEFGWRGYLLPVLRSRWGMLTSSLGVGLLWAGWHIPLFLIPGTDQSHLPAVSYVLLVLAMSVILTWIFEGSGGSLPLAMLFHGGLNAYAYYPAGGLSAVRTPLGYNLIVASYLALAVLVAFGSFRRSKSSETQTQIHV